MPFNDSSLKQEVAKLAKLTNVKGGLPPTLRGVPVAAILAGGILSKMTRGANVIEDRLLGVDDGKAILLKGKESDEKESVPGEQVGKENLDMEGASKDETGEGEKQNLGENVATGSRAEKS